MAVDRDHQVIVAVGVSNQPPDVEHLEPMSERISSNAGARPDEMTMDAGIDAYLAIGCLPYRSRHRQNGDRYPAMPTP